MDEQPTVDEATVDEVTVGEERGRFAAGDDVTPLLGESFAGLARALLDAGDGDGGPDVLGVLDRITQVGARIVAGADIVSVTLRRHDGRGYTTPAGTDPQAWRLDEAQYRHGEGPCVTALERGGLGTARSDDLAEDRHWPAFGPDAARLGAGSLFAVGLFGVGDPPQRGALNFYSRRRDAFGPGDRDTALLLASHAAVALAHVRATAAADLARTDLALAREHLDVTKASRDVIGQAKGILMERQGLSADQAFDTLRRASRDLNVKLREVAETFVANRERI